MAARIVYCDDSKPGITRSKVRNGWAYFDTNGARITDRDEIDRLNRVGLPPAYTNAWYCPKANGHIQAVGWDEKGRKQYRYHTDFREAQEAAKYERCAEFGHALPDLRRAVERDLGMRALTKDRAVAAVVRLLDVANIRVGNEAYAQANKSFGATTLRKRHGTVRGDTLKLRYKGKSGKERDCAVTDKRLAATVRRMQDLDEQHLFAWVDADGVAHPVTSSDVNAYIKAATGGDFSAKHFRTWGASVCAFEALATAEADLSLKAMLEPVVERLGNTPAIARKSYVHPALIALVKTGQSAFRKALRLPRAGRWLSREERGLIAFLEAGTPASKPPATLAPEALKKAA
ncbi:MULTISPECIES: DNA topoisomerase IB [unclassified Sphingomonas]|uniref:DNA topoisomerase IB n=1 Tax=unclassified Sphingomonas TaxID=196159 RepID=UPI000E102374|nr:MULTISPECIES: DNA topoisomerase IB [unclassified Sphingomonas]AXJ94653.1 DNA topoisomerase IB [Sphingomonas sp. FARSPH]